jgi:hypothetical protein
MRVLHVVNSFDPACDVLRCVRELNKYSAHFHTLYVQEEHPLQRVYQYDQPERPGWVMTSAEKRAMVDEADVLIYHFVGWEEGLVDETNKPCAFRNINVYYSWDRNRFWTDSKYNAQSYGRYKLLASSHVGAQDFIHPNSKFRWLPDLLPLNWGYTFDPADRPQPAISYIKHANELRKMDFWDVARLDCFQTAHAEVLSKRRALASVVIDNVSDGHYGMAGLEAAILGLPVVVYNHERTLEAMAGWGVNEPGFPFIQAESLEQAVATAVGIARDITGDRPYRRAIRAWAEKYLDPRRLIAVYWDSFIKELAE